MNRLSAMCAFVVAVLVACVGHGQAPVDDRPLATIGGRANATRAPALDIDGSAFESAVCATPPACGPQWWVRGEYVVWGIGTSKLVELGMNAFNSDLFNGLLADTGKNYKGVIQRLLGDDRTGYRIGAGGWLNKEQTLGVEADYLRVSRGPLDFSIGNNRDFNPVARIVPNGDIILQHAGFLPNGPSVSDPRLLAYVLRHRKDRDIQALLLMSKIGLPGIDAGGREVVIPYARDLANGSATFELGQQTFWALDLLGKARMYNGDGVTVEGIAGYRRVSYTDALAIRTDAVTLSRPLLPGTTLQSTDVVRTENTYDGALVGVDVGWRSGHWLLSTRVTATLANYEADADLAGYKTITFPDGRRLAVSGGTYLRSADVGSYSAGGWTVISEFSGRATRTFGEHFALTLGGSFMYVPDAALRGGTTPARDRSGSSRRGPHRVDSGPSHAREPDRNFLGHHVRGTGIPLLIRHGGDSFPALPQVPFAMPWLRSRRFQLLLITMLLLLVVVPAAPSGFVSRLFAGFLITVVLVASLWILIQRGKNRLLFIALGVATLIGNWTGYVMHDQLNLFLVIGLNLLTAAFLGFTLISIVGTVYEEELVTTEGICAGLCGYLLVGLLFAHLYLVSEAIVPGSFKGDAEFGDALVDPSHARFRLTYFSFVTLTTLGYGDITPASGLTRGLVMVEAIVGQFYVAVLIADLVGKKIALAMLERSSNSAGPSKQ